LPMMVSRLNECMTKKIRISKYDLKKHKKIFKYDLRMQEKDKKSLFLVISDSVESQQNDSPVEIRIDLIAALLHLYAKFDSLEDGLEMKVLAQQAAHNDIWEWIEIKGFGNMAPLKLRRKRATKEEMKKRS